MESNFTDQFFINNRKKLRELFMGTAPIIIGANGLLQKSGDVGFDFQQDANFWYLTGLNDPDLILVMDKTREYIIVPQRSSVQEAFDGSINHEKLSNISGVETIYDQAAGWRELSRRIKKVKHIATPSASPPYIEHFGLYTNPSRRRLISRIKTLNPGLELLDIGMHLSRMRMIKQPEEILALQSAIDITVASIKAATTLKKLTGYKYEYELEAMIGAGFRSRGAVGHSFEPVIASGQNSCTMHHMDNNDLISENSLIVIDVGAENDHYAADITRTYVSDNSPTKRHMAVYKAVCEVQDYAFSILKPGVVVHDYEEEVEQFMGEKLRELGLIKTIDRNSIRHYYPHATSHYLGIEAHDTGDYGRPLEPNAVLTVEPGIYIPEEGIGIRIEDDILITESGNQNLSKSLKRQLDVK